MTSTDQPTGNLELVATVDPPMPTGVAVSHSGRIFVNYPKWGDEVPATVVELRDGRRVPFPDESWNQPDSDDDAARVRLGAVRGRRPARPAVGGRHRRADVAADPARRAQAGLRRPRHRRGRPGHHLPDRTSRCRRRYLNDVRFDLRRGEQGTAFVTDSARPGPQRDHRGRPGHRARRGAGCTTTRPPRRRRWPPPGRWSRAGRFLDRPGDADPAPLTLRQRRDRHLRRRRPAVLLPADVPAPLQRLGRRAGRPVAGRRRGRRHGGRRGRQGQLLRRPGERRRRAGSTSPRTSRTRSSGVDPDGGFETAGRTTRGCSGRTPCRWPPTATST